jgi:hypothetical protein
MADNDRLKNLRVALILVGVIFLFGILSLIWFTVWSSVVHAAIMTVQSFEAPENHGHLLGDVPALIFVAVLLAVLTPRGERARVGWSRSSMLVQAVASIERDFELAGYHTASLSSGLAHRAVPRRRSEHRRPCSTTPKCYQA